jgi:hypothetical protein
MSVYNYRKGEVFGCGGDGGVYLWERYKDTFQLWSTPRPALTMAIVREQLLRGSELES